MQKGIMQGLSPQLAMAQAQQMAHQMGLISSPPPLSPLICLLFPPPFSPSKNGWVHGAVTAAVFYGFCDICQKRLPYISKDNYVNQKRPMCVPPLSLCLSVSHAHTYTYNNVGGMVPGVLCWHTFSQYMRICKHKYIHLYTHVHICTYLFTCVYIYMNGMYYVYIYVGFVAM